MRIHQHLTFLVLLSLFCTTAVHADPFKEPPASDARIKMLRYDENDVYTITTKYGYQTNVTFDRGESIETISVGDRSLWQIIPSGNRLFIRPMQQGVTTNMTLLTNKRAYQFDLKSLADGEKDTDLIYVAKFTYDTLPPPPPVFVPPPPLPPMPSAMPAPAPVQPAKTEVVYTNYNYTYSGPDELAPLQVFDDGKHTFIKYLKIPDPMPTIQIIEGNGTRIPLSVQTQGSVIEVPLVTNTMEITYGSGAIVVYNEMLNVQ